MTSCTFDPETHRYYIDGVEVPGVTRIIEAGFPYRGPESDRREYAALLGTYVHDACALYSRGLLDEESLSAPLRPYVEGWKQLLATGRVEVLETEKQLWHVQRRFAGTLDCIVKFDGKEAVWDLKTGAQLSPQMGLQLAGYVELENALRATKKRRPIANRAVVHLTSEGTYQLVSYEDPADTAEFYALLTHYNWRLKHAAA